ncbi:uncharacterized protein LOC141729889 isoform X3 [Zonotrichia albicollis]|uniref:uncharacterized protein LOC141727922 isoform X3 n=1 Tax=Zonotrichia albicollis TaxID=44394 RepID=UPI003D80DEB5
MGRGAAAGALLVALVVLGAPPAAGAELSGVFQEMRTRECHFINGTEKVRFVRRYIYNRKQYMMFDSDVGVFVGDTPYGETQARCCNGIPEILEDNRAAVDTFCRAGYELAAPFLTGHRGEVVPGPAGALGARGGHRRGPQRGLDLPAAGAAGNPPPARAQLQLPGGARQPGAAPEAALGDAAGRRPQQDADGHRGLRLELRLPGAGARRLPAQEELLSRRRPQPLPVGSGPAGTPRSVPAPLILGGPVFPPAPLALCPRPVPAPSTPSKASQLGPGPFIGGRWGGVLGGDGTDLEKGRGTKGGGL